jgi:hypothetical protein
MQSGTLSFFTLSLSKGYFQHECVFGFPDALALFEVELEPCLAQCFRVKATAQQVLLQEQSAAISIELLSAKGEL